METKTISLSITAGNADARPRNLQEQMRKDIENADQDINSIGKLNSLTFVSNGDHN